MGEEGKGKLQWERDIPQDALDNLQNLANSDFKQNLGKIIHDIYLTGHNLFKDMPQGDHKKRAKYRFASKTLMRILPNELKSEVENLINRTTIQASLKNYENLISSFYNTHSYLSSFIMSRTTPVSSVDQGGDPNTHLICILIK